MTSEEVEMVFHFRLKRSENPELYEAIMARPKGRRSQYIRSLLVDNYGEGKGRSLQVLLEKLAQRGEYQTELLVGVHSLLKRLCSTGPVPYGPVEKNGVEAERGVDSSMSKNMIEMYTTLNTE